MYLPGHFAENDLARLDALVAANPFATLVTVDADGVPFASHLPVLYRRDGDAVEFRGHWARPNPQSRHSGPALLVVNGPHAYVSPGWYPDKSAGSGFGQPQAGPEDSSHGRDEHKEATARVPTWNYAVAHCSGRLQAIDDEQALAGLVDALSRRHEAEVGSDWRFEPGRDDHRRKLRGIVGFRLRPERIELKFKLNQNHPAANVEAAAAALAARGGEGASAIAEMMLSALHARPRTEPT